METKGKRKYAVMLLVIMMLQVILPTASMLKENIFTNFSSAKDNYKILLGGGVTADVTNGGKTVNVHGGSEGGRIGLTLVEAMNLDWYSYGKDTGEAYKVEKITFDENVTYIPPYFCHYTALVEESYEHIGMQNITAATKQSIGVLANLKTVVGAGEKNKITTIDSQIFNNCKKLDTVTGFNNILSIADGAFYGCESLTNFNGGSLSHTCKYLGKNAFKNTKITSLMAIPETCVIGDDCFAGNKGRLVLDARNIDGFVNETEFKQVKKERKRIGLGDDDIVIINTTRNYNKKDDWKNNILIIYTLKGRSTTQDNGYYYKVSPVVIENNYLTFPACSKEISKTGYYLPKNEYLNSLRSEVEI